MNHLLTSADLKILHSNQDFLEIPRQLSPEFIALIEKISCESYSHFEDYDDDRSSHVYTGYREVDYLDEDGNEDTATITVYRGYVVPEGTDDDSADLDFTESVSEKYTIEF